MEIEARRAKESLNEARIIYAAHQGHVNSQHVAKVIDI